MFSVNVAMLLTVNRQYPKFFKSMTTGAVVRRRRVHTLTLVEESSSCVFGSVYISLMVTSAKDFEISTFKNIQRQMIFY